jgi:hypothetical protein
MVCECEDDGFKKKLKPHSTTLLISHLGPSCSLAKRGENLGLATEFPIWDVSPVQLPGLVVDRHLDSPRKWMSISGPTDLTVFQPCGAFVCV